MKSPAEKAMGLSLMSTILTGVLTSIHHAYEIGLGAVVLALVVVVSPLLSFRRFRKTGSKVALWVYRLLTAWLVVGFGLVDGFWNHTVRPLGFQLYALIALHGGGTTTIKKAAEGNSIHEGTGILTFIAAMFAMYYGFKLIQASRQFEITNLQNI